MLWIILGIFGSSFVIALSGALMPGPLLTYTAAAAAQRGFWAGPKVILGHGILELTLLVLLLIGVGVFLNRPLIIGGIALTGALVLWWLGYDMLTSARQARLVLEGEASQGIGPVWAGILMSLANPYWFIWWLTLGLGYVLLAWNHGLAGVIAFFSGHILADLGWYSLVALAVAQGKKVISDRGYRWFVAGCAVFLLIFAGYFGYHGLKILWLE